jgi:hypothetical protein
LKPACRLPALLLTSGLVTLTAQAETFRWVDEKGAVHYSDQVPPAEARTPRSKLNARGFEVETVEAPKTREQAEREHLLQQLRTQQEKVLNEQRDKDQALMRTYRSTDEILSALKVKLDSLESTIRMTQASIERDAQTLANHEQRASTFTSKGQAVPQATHDSIASLKRRMVAYRNQVARTENEKLATTDQFGRDIKRFQAIKAMQERHENPDADWTRGVAKAMLDGHGDVISVVACAVNEHCDQYWTLAGNYLRQTIGSPLSVETRKILQTPYPRNDTEFGITITRLSGKSNFLIFMDVICRPTSVGEQLCKSNRVKEIHQGFRKTLLSSASSKDPETDSAH